MITPGAWMGHLCTVSDEETRSVSAENPDGARGGGARASPGDDRSCSTAARRLGKGWKVRPCLRDIGPGGTAVLADVDGPGVVRHIWCTVRPDLLGLLELRVTYDGRPDPSVLAPLGHFFANGIDGLAQVRSLPIAVNPRGGMNSYWPMPFRRRLRLEIANAGDEAVPELFYQVTYGRRELPPGVACLHAAFRRSVTDPAHPEHVILDGVRGRGHYAGTSVAWHTRFHGWWGEGEVKFFIDGDPPDGPTVCGTGTEDYFGGAWGFLGDDPADPRPVNYSGPFLGYPQRREGHAGAVAAHGLYRWHIPDPVCFTRNLRVTIQALGWGDDGTYAPLADEIASVAYWYQEAGPA